MIKWSIRSKSEFDEFNRRLSSYAPYRELDIPAESIINIGRSPDYIYIKWRILNEDEIAGIWIDGKDHHTYEYKFEIDGEIYDETRCHKDPEELLQVLHDQHVLGVLSRV